jgi:hypothetical protein
VASAPTIACAISRSLPDTAPLSTDRLCTSRAIATRRAASASPSSRIWAVVGPSARSSCRMSRPRPAVPTSAPVTRIWKNSRVSASSADSSSSESIGTSVRAIGMIPSRGMGRPGGRPGKMSTCMSFSGVLGRSTARAFVYTRGSTAGSISIETIARPSRSSLPTTVPTFTPATLTGCPSPGVTAPALANSTRSGYRSCHGRLSRW